MIVDRNCSPGKNMSSRNINDAKEECLTNPNCHMFYNIRGEGKYFWACEVPGSMTDSFSGDILYRPEGNNAYTQFY